MMFENGILAEIEVDNLDSLEKTIKRIHGDKRKIKVLNVQYCKKRVLDSLRERYESEYYYKVFILIGETFEQAKRNKEDREHLMEEKYKERKANEKQEIFEASLSDKELAEYRLRKKIEKDKELDKIQLERERKQSLPYLKEKLEEAKANANKTTKSFTNRFNI